MFRSHYQSIYLQQTRPMVGAKEILEGIAESGRPQSVVTNKLGVSARELIGHFGWRKVLPHCLGEGDGFLLKPSPEMILAASSRMGVALSQILFVGDSPFDFEAARAAGIPICLLTTGTHGPDELRALTPDLLFDSLKELEEWFFRESGMDRKIPES
jgi:HAD superfamily hydrolase (TIGR01509 family)